MKGTMKPASEMCVNLQKAVDVASTKEYIVKIDEASGLAFVPIRTVNDGLLAEDALLDSLCLVDDLLSQLNVRIFPLIERAA